MPILTIYGTGVSIETREGEAILPALIRTGYSYKFGCKRGGCGICKLDLVEGEVEYPVTVADSVLGEEEKKTTVLSCRAVPVTDVTIRMNPENMFKSVAPFFAALFSNTAKAMTPTVTRVTLMSGTSTSEKSDTPDESEPAAGNGTEPGKNNASPRVASDENENTTSDEDSKSTL